MTYPSEYVRDRDSVCPHISSQNVGERTLFLVWCFGGACRSISHYIIEGNHSMSGGGGVLCGSGYIYTFVYILWCVV